MATMAIPEAQSTVEVQDSASDREALLLRLDELLEKYLDTLDRYQKAQQQLTAHFTSGFLSLAQANFSNQSRTRYGQDYYDDRMQALAKVHVGAEPTVAFTVVREQTAAAPKGTASPSENVTAAEKSSGSREELASDSETLRSEKEPLVQDTPSGRADATPASRDSETEEPAAKKSSDSRGYRDPLKWFGILVPSTLRSSQASFVQAVEGAIPEQATLVHDLRRQEIDIGRLRKQIRKL